MRKKETPRQRKRVKDKLTRKKTVLSKGIYCTTEYLLNITTL
jgi:hypothetical protein